MKAILVVDIPKGYEVDQLAVNYMLYSIDGKVLDGDMGKELKSMPSNLDWSTINRCICDTDSFEYGICCGRQELIDEILGDTE